MSERTTSAEDTQNQHCQCVHTNVDSGGTAVDTGFERRLVVNQVTCWMIVNVGQQRLRAVEQRVSKAREQHSWATRVKAAQDGLSKAMRQVLAASSTSEVSRASDAGVVEEDQMGGDKPVSMIGSPMCQSFCCVIITMTRDANRVSDEKGCAKCWEMQESCSCMRICGTDGLVDSPSP